MLFLLLFCFQVNAAVMTPQKALEESRPLLWREIAKDVPGRTNKDCRRRWNNSLNDSISKGRWSQIEDQRLFQGVQKYGTNWVRVAAIVRTRNPDQCATHWGQALNPAIDYSDWSDAEVCIACLWTAGILTKQIGL